MIPTSPTTPTKPKTRTGATPLHQAPTLDQTTTVIQLTAVLEALAALATKLDKDKAGLNTALEELKTHSNSIAEYCLKLNSKMTTLQAENAELKEMVRELTDEVYILGGLVQGHEPDEYYECGEDGEENYADYDDQVNEDEYAAEGQVLNRLAPVAASALPAVDEAEADDEVEVETDEDEVDDEVEVEVVTDEDEVDDEVEVDDETDEVEAATVVNVTHKVEAANDALMDMITTDEDKAKVDDANKKEGEGEEQHKIGTLAPPNGSPRKKNNKVATAPSAKPAFVAPKSPNSPFIATASKATAPTPSAPPAALKSPSKSTVTSSSAGTSLFAATMARTTVAPTSVPARPSATIDATAHGDAKAAGSSSVPTIALAIPPTPRTAWKTVTSPTTGPARLHNLVHSRSSLRLKALSKFDPTVVIEAPANEDQADTK